MPVADTSVTAYHDLIREHQITPRCAELLKCLIDYGPQADFEIAARLGWHQSQVSARRGDLVNDQNTGTVVFTGEYKANPGTGKRVRIWRANISRQPSLI